MKRMIMIALVLALGLSLSVPGLAESADTGANMLMGGWQIPADGTPTEETRDLLNRAFNGIDGNAIEPIAVLGTQLVAGKNTCILCRITPAVPDAVSYFAVIYVYEDPTGKTTLDMIVELDPGTIHEAVNYDMYDTGEDGSPDENG